MKNKPILQRHKLDLMTAGNIPLHIDGLSEFEFMIRGLKMTHTFYIVGNLNRNVIVGLDWLQSRGVCVYHDFGCIRVNGTYVPLVEDIHIASVARLKHKTKIPSQTGHICQCQIRKHNDLPTTCEYEISPFEIGQIGSEPGLSMMNSVAKLFLSFKPGTPIARIKQICSTEIMNVRKNSKDMSVKNKNSKQVNTIAKNYLENLNVLSE